MNYSDLRSKYDVFAGEINDKRFQLQKVRDEINEIEVQIEKKVFDMMNFDFKTYGFHNVRYSNILELKNMLDLKLVDLKHKESQLCLELDNVQNKNKIFMDKILEICEENLDELKKEQEKYQKEQARQQSYNDDCSLVIKNCESEITLLQLRLNSFAQYELVGLMSKKDILEKESIECEIKKLQDQINENSKKIASVSASRKLDEINGVISDYNSLISDVNSVLSVVNNSSLDKVNDDNDMVNSNEASSLNSDLTRFVPNSDLLAILGDSSNVQNTVSDDSLDTPKPSYNDSVDNLEKMSSDDSILDFLSTLDASGVQNTVSNDSLDMPRPLHNHDVDNLGKMSKEELINLVISRSSAVPEADYDNFTIDDIGIGKFDACDGKVYFATDDSYKCEINDLLGNKCRYLMITDVADKLSMFLAKYLRKPIKKKVDRSKIFGKVKRLVSKNNRNNVLKKGINFLKNYFIEEVKQDDVLSVDGEYIICPDCGEKNPVGLAQCFRCGMPFDIDKYYDDSNGRTL